jgi:hypothetical protein
MVWTTDQTTKELLFISDFDLCYVNADIFWMFVLYSCIVFTTDHGNQYASIFVDCSYSCFSRNVEDMHGWYLLCQALVNEYCCRINANIRTCKWSEILFLSSPAPNFRFLLKLKSKTHEQLRE